MKIPDINVKYKISLKDKIVILIVILIALFLSIKAISSPQFNDGNSECYPDTSISTDYDYQDQDTGTYDTYDNESIYESDGDN